MKKLVSSILLALMITAFGASTAFANGGDFILNRIEKQRAERQAAAANHPDTGKSDNTPACCVQDTKN
ncbi:MAG TPA: hypothetical protein PKA10_12285 [Selenomonadales bacterium]|nr:hypothetical protein [Selenomonadales bacterium]